MFRPRLQFGLRTLLVVVTVLAFTFGYVANESATVRERLRLLKWIEERSVPKSKKFYTPEQAKDAICHSWGVRFEDSDLSWFRWFLGDHYATHIWHPEEAPKPEVKRVWTMFPEAKIISCADYTDWPQ